MLSEREKKLKELLQEIEADLPSNVRKVKFAVDENATESLAVRVDLLLKRNTSSTKKSIKELNQYKDSIRNNFINNGFSFPYIYLM